MLTPEELLRLQAMGGPAGPPSQLGQVPGTSPGAPLGDPTRGAGSGIPAGTWNDPFTLSGILNDPDQLQSLAGNPLFNMGMGVLASSYDPNVNPYQAAMQGLRTAGEEQRTLDEEERDQLLRDQLIEFFKADPEAKSRLRAFMGVQPEPAQTGGPYGADDDPMSRLYRIGWDRIFNPR